MACYEMLEPEGEQHLVDPMLPVVARLCAAARREEEEEDDYLPLLDWLWIDALLGRVFLSESPTQAGVGQVGRRCVTRRPTVATLPVTPRRFGGN